MPSRSSRPRFHRALARDALPLLLLLAVAPIAAGQPPDAREAPRADPARTDVTCKPVETRPPNAAEQKPEFPDQTRA